MSWVLFIVVLVVSFTIVRIGAIAFQLTGLEWSLAKFQALSCFTGTGFTTKEAELITGNTQRRRIASVLMVLGNAGLVIMIATFANSLNPRQIVESRLTKPLLPFVPAELVVIVNIAVIILSVYVVYKVFTHPAFSKKMTDFLRKKVIKKELFKRVSFEELFLATGGYGVSRVTVRGGSPVAGKSLLEANLRKLDVMVLAIVRGEKTMANPGPDTKIHQGDEVICFGRLENIRQKLT